jgi:eukaryotic-like serine/threonine-protein kinase
VTTSQSEMLRMDSLPEISDFEIISKLGYGARSTIYAVSEKRTGQLYALKRVVRRVPEDDRFLEQAEQEFAISSQFNHPALRRSVRMIRRRRLLKVSELYLLMELFDGTALDVQRPKTVDAMIKVFIQVAHGLSVMHRIGFVHADIKPNNILVNEAMQAKVIDFGQSCAVGTVKQRIQGTPDYIAPEQVGRGRLTPATDIFNFGATMYWCFTDRHIPTLIPKKKSGPVQAVEKSRDLLDPHEVNPRVPLPLSRLIVDCVQNRPSARPQEASAVISRLELALTVANAEGPRNIWPSSPKSSSSSSTTAEESSERPR